VSTVWVQCRCPQKPVALDALRVSCLARVMGTVQVGESTVRVQSGYSESMVRVQ
jgi:hypothetical protein